MKLKRLSSPRLKFLGPAPAAIATTMVSPMALEIATTKAAEIPERAAGRTTLIGHLELGRPQRQRSLPKRTGHRRQGVLGQRGDQRDDQDSDHDPGRGVVEDLDRALAEDGPEQRGHEGQREVAKHDSGDAGQDLENRFEEVANPGRRVLGEIDGRGQADRKRHQHGDRRS